MHMYGNDCSLQCCFPIDDISLLSSWRYSRSSSKVEILARFSVSTVNTGDIIATIIDRGSYFSSFVAKVHQIRVSVRVRHCSLQSRFVIYDNLLQFQDIGNKIVKSRIWKLSRLQNFRGNDPEEAEIFMPLLEKFSATLSTDPDDISQSTPDFWPLFDF